MVKYPKYRQTAQLIIDQKEIQLKSVLYPDGLVFDFSVRRTKFEPFAEISLQLYNASAETVDAANRKKVEDGKINPLRNVAQITLKAGYNDNNSTLFSGTVFSALTEYQATEKITRIKISNYSDEIKFQKIKISWPTPVTLSKGLKDICDLLGVSTRVDLSGANDKKIGTSCFIGTLDDFLVQCYNSNPTFTYQVYNDFVVLSDASPVNNNNFVEELNTDNGMILTPTLTDMNLVRVNALFNPAYVIDAPIKVKSIKFQQPEVVGSIYSVSHTGGYRGISSSIDILPRGQVAPLPNIGVSA
jgi:hypothetical protein